FGFAEDEGGAKALAVGVLELLAELLGFGMELDADAASAKLRGKLEIVVAAARVEHAEQSRRGRFSRLKPSQLFERGEQAIEAQRSADAGQLLSRVQAGQIIVPAAAGHAANGRQFVKLRFDDDAGVVVETAGDRRIEFYSRRRDAS